MYQYSIAFLCRRGEFRVQQGPRLENQSRPSLLLFMLGVAPSTVCIAVSGVPGAPCAPCF